jgi:hypothetical protein
VNRRTGYRKSVINQPRPPVLSRGELLAWYGLLEAALDQPNPSRALRDAIDRLAAERRKD